MKPLRFTLLFLLCLLHGSLSSAALGHGSVVAEGDLCVISIGFYTAHFKVFQPASSQQTEFCEDLPDTGEAIFVMEYLHQLLSEATIEFRIVTDVTGLGRFAKLADVERIADLDAITVFHQPPSVSPQVFTVLHDFTEAGDFLGLVTVVNPRSGESYSAVFPFSVGFRGWGLLPLFLGLGLLTQLGYWISTGGYSRWRDGSQSGKTAAQAPLLLVLVLCAGLPVPAEAEPVKSGSGKLQVEWISAVNPPPLNRIHQWTLRLSTAAGEPVENARIDVIGGMPAHNHGLPTSPAVTEEGKGVYLLSGMRFHMQGEWILTLTITQASGQDTIRIPLTL